MCGHACMCVCMRMWPWLLARYILATMHQPYLFLVWKAVIKTVRIRQHGCICIHVSHMLPSDGRWHLQSTGSIVRRSAAERLCAGVPCVRAFVRVCVRACMRVIDRTRSFGDLLLSTVGVTHEPELMSVPLVRDNALCRASDEASLSKK